MQCVETKPLSYAKERDPSCHMLLNTVQWIKQCEAIGVICRWSFVECAWTWAWLEDSMKWKGGGEWRLEDRVVRDRKNRSLEKFCLKDEGKNGQYLERGHGVKKVLFFVVIFKEVSYSNIFSQRWNWCSTEAESEKGSLEEPRLWVGGEDGMTTQQMGWLSWNRKEAYMGQTGGGWVDEMGRVLEVLFSLFPLFSHLRSKFISWRVGWQRSTFVLESGRRKGPEGKHTTARQC